VAETFSDTKVRNILPALADGIFMDAHRLLTPSPHRVLALPGVCLSCTTFLPFWLAEGEKTYTGRMKYCPLCRRYRLVPMTTVEA